MVTLHLPWGAPISWGGDEVSTSHGTVELAWLEPAPSPPPARGQHVPRKVRLPDLLRENTARAVGWGGVLALRLGGVE
jgi:hypothetical protein